MNQFITQSKSGLGRGGMHTKYTYARKMSLEGTDVFIANGKRDSIITDIVKRKNVPCTHFPASNRKKTGVKKWLAHSETFSKGEVFINEGAKGALLNGKSSLLIIGITGVKGFFKSGDIVTIFDENLTRIGLGMAQYDSEKVEQLIGQKMKKPFIHHDYLVLSNKV
jgi:glutamate 5-kinase